MNCRNHASAAAADRCVACAEPFCGDCLVEILGEKYCGSCKVVTVKGPPEIEGGSVPCEAANKALVYSIIGIFCFGIVLGPMAVAKALEARRQIRDDPSLSGLVKANIGLLLGVTVLMFWIMGMVARVKNAGQ